MSAAILVVTAILPSGHPDASQALENRVIQTDSKCATWPLEVDLLFIGHANRFWGKARHTVTYL